MSVLQTEEKHPRTAGNLGLLTVFALVAVVPALLVLELRRPAGGRGPNGTAQPGMPDGSAIGFGLAVDKPTLDLGDFPPNGFQSGTFTLTNVSAQTLMLDKVETSCGCTTASLSARIVRPGESVLIPVQVNTSALGNGEFAKFLVVTLANPFQGRTFSLAVKGTVKDLRSFLALPGAIDFGTLTKGEELHRRVHVRGLANVMKSLPDTIVLGRNGSYELTVPSPTPMQPDVWKTITIILGRAELNSSDNKGSASISVNTVEGGVLCTIPIRFTLLEKHGPN